MIGAMLGRPAILHEQNAFFGRANRFLARHAREIALSWENTSNIPETEKSKVFIAGMPVREAFRSTPAYTPPPATGEIRLLIVGGSLGAKVFGETVPEAISRLPAALRQRLVITQQARKDQIDAVRSQYEKAGVRAELHEFITNMPEHLGQTHLVISRAGASSVAELAASGRPALLVLPGAMDDHQTANAKTVARVGGGWCIPETEMSAGSLAGRIAALVTSKDELKRAASAISQLDPGLRRHPDRACLSTDRRNTPRMSQLPLSIGRIHFTGIGGIGMSGIAEILHDMGYEVQGSDSAENTNVQRLRDKGITIMVGQQAANIANATIVVVSTAIKADNPEVMEARRRFLPVVHRAEMLGELMRLRWSVAIAGTHGKTTTTSLVATLLDAGGIDPTVINGGIITGWGSNARLGESDWMVVEADESDGSFSRLNPTVAVVTNIDPEHLDHHGDFDNLKAAFRQFVASIPFYGFATLCIDHPVVQRMMPEIPERRLITYGLSASADIRATNLTASDEGMRFDVMISRRIDAGMEMIPDVLLPMLGEHNAELPCSDQCGAGNGDQRSGHS